MNFDWDVYEWTNDVGRFYADMSDPEDENEELAHLYSVTQPTPIGAVLSRAKYFGELKFHLATQRR